MSKKNFNIIIVDTSHIVYEGILSILTKTAYPYNFHLTDSLFELQQINIRIKADIILINPILIQNQNKEFLTLKKEFENTIWIGMVYSYFDNQVIASFDEIIFINDSPNKIISQIRNLLSRQQPDNKNTQHETLSNREIDVLKLLVEGKSNKEIADKLNISTNTVISHRKNITSKTEIKSVAGLTIYAVVNNIVTLDNYRD